MLENRPPHISSVDKKRKSDKELAALYEQVIRYYRTLPFDEKKAAKEDRFYRRLVGPNRIFMALKRTVALRQELLPDDLNGIYVANHIGSFDQFYIGEVLRGPVRYLVNEKIPTWPIRWHLLYKPSGVVVVDQKSLSSWRQAKTFLNQYVMQGRSTFIFPEGHRMGPDNIGAFNPGVIEHAQETGQSIVTMAVKNTEKLLATKRPIICVGRTVEVGRRDDIRDKAHEVREAVLEAYDFICEYEAGAHAARIYS